MCGPWPATVGAHRPLPSAQEALEVFAQRAPNDITDVLNRLRRRGAWTALWCVLTGSQPVPRPATTCGTRILHKAFGGNVQVLTDHTGFPVWTSPVEPGSTHDITATLPRCSGRPHWDWPPWRTRATQGPASASRSWTGTPPRSPTPDGATN